MKLLLARIHQGLVAFIALGVLVQMFLAGVWHAGVVSTPEAHVFFGLGLLLASLVALIVAAVARLPRRLVVLTGLLFVLILLQPILIETRRMGLPFVSAFHTLNASFVGMTASAVFGLARSTQVGEAQKAVTAVAPATGD